MNERTLGWQPSCDCQCETDAALAPVAPAVVLDPFVGSRHRPLCGPQTRPPRHRHRPERRLPSPSSQTATATIPIHGGQPRRPSSLTRHHHLRPAVRTTSTTSHNQAAHLRCLQDLLLAGSRVARCESGLRTWARNGQYLGLFQMGYVGTVPVRTQQHSTGPSHHAYRYFVASGRDWSPWTCKP